MKTTMVNPNEIERKWYVVDAEGKTLGRLATEIARILRGKHKPIYTPHLDTGDHVIVLNAGKVVLTGKKLDQKLFRTHSLYPGGLKEVPYRKMLAEKPEKVVYEAVRGMIPHNRLGRQMMTKLRVYRGTEHPHEAQKPEVLDINA
ncbi:50S ribosomal protein L13 [Irregularibacter muris]|uniref:Large ribosomal subunit protein uL13 n=1 Tax=Irregularibacter muris TaxID=1796619 RepID=A0AAE3HGF2_9FIRM|nr:50S ribosomal protein L13 [Irregularibacter muris]MCR1898633.1 50S ribosomal protein L13 [Irregularibacter muris]